MDSRQLASLISRYRRRLSMPIAASQIRSRRCQCFHPFTCRNSKQTLTFVSRPRLNKIQVETQLENTIRHRGVLDAFKSEKLHMKRSKQKVSGPETEGTSWSKLAQIPMLQRPLAIKKRAQLEKSKTVWSCINRPSKSVTIPHHSKWAINSKWTR